MDTGNGLTDHTVAEGDTIILSDGKGHRHHVRVTLDMLKVGRLGVVDGSRLLGMRFGERFAVGKFEGFILRSTPRGGAQLGR